MTPRSATSCAHELRPGTTVCLHCRAEARTALRARQRGTAVKLLAAGGAVLVLGVLVFAGMSIRGTQERAVPVTRIASAADSAAGPGGASSAALASPPPGTRSGGATPLVPAGRTELGNGVFAERQGNVIVVNFDTQGSRTRRSDKFEAVVRRTLPAILGDVGRTALDRVQPGALVPAGELLAAVDRGALRLPVGDGRVVHLTPMTRMGEDGPLVVTYRVVIDPPLPTPAT